MLMGRLAAVTIAVAMVAGTGGYLIAAGQLSAAKGPTTPLARRVEGMTLEKASAVEAVRQVLQSAGVPGGIADLTCGDEKRHDFRFQRSSLDKVLDSIVSVDSHYTWRIDDGVVNFLTAESQPNLLDVKILEFRLENVSSLLFAVDQLLARQEVAARAAELDLQPRMRQLGMGPLKRPGSSSTYRGLNVELRNVTLRQALNALARKHGRAVWFYRQNSCDGVKGTYELDFVVR